MLFPKCCSFEVEEIICGHILKVNVQYENVKMVYTPVLSIERMRFLNVLCDFHNCTDDFLFVGGGFLLHRKCQIG